MTKFNLIKNVFCSERWGETCETVTVTGGNEGEIAEKPEDKARGREFCLIYENYNYHTQPPPQPQPQLTTNDVSVELTTSAWDMNSSTSSLLSIVPN